MARGDSLEAIEPWLGGMLEKVSPRERKRLLDKLMRMVRRENANRIRANREPDGASMAKRKERPALRERGRNGGKAKTGRMFPKIAAAKALGIRITPDSAELRFNSRRVESIAATHHYGLPGFVGRTRDGRVIRTTYTARRLIGFGKEADDFLEELVKHMGA